MPQATASERLVESVLREADDGTRYLLITNVNWNRSVQPRFVIDGHHRNLVDLGLGGGIPVPSETAHGLTVFDRHFDAGEGTIIRLGRVEPTAQPASQAKAAWTEHFFTRKDLADAQRAGLAVESATRRLIDAAANIRKANYREASSALRAIEASIEQLRTTAGSDRLRTVARELAGRIDRSKRDPVSEARIEALRKMGEYAIGVNRKNAEFYLNIAKGWINLPELPVRRTEISFRVPTAGEVTIDGDLAEWQDAQWQHIPPTRAWHGNPRGEEDVNAYFATKWDEAHFYLAAKVADDVVINEAPTADMLWEQDSIEVHINVLDDYGLPKEGGAGDGLPLPIYGPDDFQFGFDIHGRMTGSSANPLNVQPEGSKVGVETTDDGYRMEVAIPWAAMFLEPVPGYTVGFTMSVNDTDNRAARYEKQLTWRGRKVCENTEGWGRLELSK